VNIRPHSFDFPLFLHVLGAMALFGAVLTTAVVSWAGGRGGQLALRRTAFWSLVAVAVPAYVAMRGGAQWIYSKEGFSGHGDPTWIGIGFGVADAGLIVLLLAIGVAYWWRRSGKPLAGRISAGIASIYLVLLAIAWLAMSGKWGS
jgi:hypothetical protein